MGQDLGPVKLTVTLDTEEARRQIAELKSSLGKPSPSAPTTSSTTTPVAAVEGNAERGRKKLLEQFRREVQAAKNLKNAGKRAPIPGHTGQQSVVSLLAGAVQSRATGAALSSPVAGVAQTVAGSGLLSSAAVKGVGTAALIYGAFRLGTEQQVMMMEILKGLLPTALTDNVIFKGLQDFYEGLARRFDALESSVIASLRTVGTTSEYAAASARISGNLPGVITRIPSQLKDDWIVETQKERLDYAFGRFRRKKFATDLGQNLSEIISGWNR